MTSTFIIYLFVPENEKKKTINFMTKMVNSTSTVTSKIKCPQETDVIY